MSVPIVYVFRVDALVEYPDGKGKPVSKTVVAVDLGRAIERVRTLLESVNFGGQEPNVKVTIVGSSVVSKVDIFLQEDL